jgi:SRSO17 transposase
MTANCEAIDPGQLDRLQRFWSPILVEIETRGERRLATDYVHGLLGPTERKTSEPMVRTALGVDEAPGRERAMQRMLSDGSWNHRGVTLLGAERLMMHGTFDAYTLDDTSILKQGQDSVGVANQYAGCVGGLANSQSVVTVGVASEHVSALIAAELFLPASWCSPDAAAQRKKTRVPEGTRHRTKAEIGLQIVRDVREAGLPRLPWLCDSAYGDNTSFRLALDAAGEVYVGGASLALTVWPRGTTFSPRERKTGAGRPPTRLLADDDARPLSIAKLAASLGPDAWQPVLWRHGSKGPQRARFAAVRVRPARGASKSNAKGTIPIADLQPEQWLLIHWPEGEPKPTKAWLSNLPDGTDIVTLVQFGRLRWRIERDHEETKGILGLDHYEGRTWPGLHHHLALVIVADQFLATEQLRTLAPPPPALGLSPPRIPAPTAAEAVGLRHRRHAASGAHSRALPPLSNVPAKVRSRTCPAV